MADNVEKEEVVEESTSTTTTKKTTTKKSAAKVQSADTGIAMFADTGDGDGTTTPVTPPAGSTVDPEVKAVLLYGAQTEVVDLGYANPTKENKEFSVDFVAKANPAVYTADVVKAVKAEFAK